MKGIPYEFICLDKQLSKTDSLAFYNNSVFRGFIQPDLAQKTVWKETCWLRNCDLKLKISFLCFIYSIRLLYLFSIVKPAKTES